MKNIPQIKISNLKFNDNTEIELKEDDIVIFVGQNNVGKSRCLQDIINILVSEKEKDRIILKNAKVVNENYKEGLMNYLEENCKKDENGYYSIEAYDGNSTINITPSELMLNLDYEPEQWMFRRINNYFINFLSTENRLKITSKIRLNDGMSNIRNKKIYKNLSTSTENIELVNKYIFEAFGYGINVYQEDENYSDIQWIYKIDNKEEIEDSIKLPGRDASAKLKDMNNLYEQGDGIRSFIGILASLIVNNASIKLIDEPETFLHPPQAKLIGKYITKLSQGQQCFISTHSIDFLKGVLEENPKRIKIIKINRNKNVNDFHILDNDSVLNISGDINLKYTNILNGLFYKKIILCENESDCKFYSAVLENLDKDKFQETLFVGLGGKSQFMKVVPLLNSLNINFSIIADIDMIQDVSELKKLVNAISKNKYEEIELMHQKFIETYNRCRRG